MQNVATRVRKACRAQIKFELLQKHSRRVKLILHSFYDKNIDHLFYKIHKVQT
jgi:hypothetical protein